MKGEKLFRHSMLEDYCKDGAVGLVKSTLLEHTDIDICFDEGAYFYFALDLSQENESLEILGALLSYANETGVNGHKLSETINNAVGRVRSKIPESAQKMIEPYLHAQDSDSCVSDEVTSSTSAISRKSSIGDCIHAASIGDIEGVKHNIDINSHQLKIRVIVAAIENKHDEVISAIADMFSSNYKKANIFRAAGDMCVDHNFFTKAEEYYNKSLEMHASYITNFKLGALYQRWSSDSSIELGEKASLQQKAMDNYTAALEHKHADTKDDEMSEKLAIITEQLSLLQKHSTPEDPDATHTATESLLTYLSDDEDTSEVHVAGEV